MKINIDDKSGRNVWWIYNTYTYITRRQREKWQAPLIIMWQHMMSGPVVATTNVQWKLECFALSSQSVLCCCFYNLQRCLSVYLTAVDIWQKLTKMIFNVKRPRRRKNNKVLQFFFSGVRADVTLILNYPKWIRYAIHSTLHVCIYRKKLLVEGQCQLKR